MSKYNRIHCYSCYLFRATIIICFLAAISVCHCCKSNSSDAEYLQNAGFPLLYLCEGWVVVWDIYPPYDTEASFPAKTIRVMMNCDNMDSYLSNWNKTKNQLIEECRKKGFWTSKIEELSKEAIRGILCKQDSTLTKEPLEEVLFVEGWPYPGHSVELRKIVLRNGVYYYEAIPQNERQQLSKICSQYLVKSSFYDGLTVPVCPQAGQVGYKLPGSSPYEKGFAQLGSTIFSCFISKNNMTMIYIPPIGYAAGVLRSSGQKKGGATVPIEIVVPGLGLYWRNKSASIFKLNDEDVHELVGSTLPDIGKSFDDLSSDNQELRKQAAMRILFFDENNRSVLLNGLSDDRPAKFKSRLYSLIRLIDWNNKQSDILRKCFSHTRFIDGNFWYHMLYFNIDSRIIEKSVEEHTFSRDSAIRLITAKTILENPEWARKYGYFALAAVLEEELPEIKIRYFQIKDGVLEEIEVSLLDELVAVLKIRFWNYLSFWAHEKLTSDNPLNSYGHMHKFYIENKDYLYWDEDNCRIELSFEAKKDCVAIDWETGQTLTEERAMEINKTLEKMKAIHIEEITPESIQKFRSSRLPK